MFFPEFGVKYSFECFSIVVVSQCSKGRARLQQQDATEEK